MTHLSDHRLADYLMNFVQAQKEENPMSKNKDIELYHKITKLPYSQCRRRLKESHWELTVALLPEWIKSLNQFSESMKPLKESLVYLAEGITNSLTVINSWLADVLNPFSSIKDDSKRQ